MTESERQHILKEAAVDHLFDLMSDTSEHHWCAGWMDGTEIALWKAAQQYPEPLKWGMFPVDLDTVRKLRDLALAPPFRAGDKPPVAWDYTARYGIIHSLRSRLPTLWTNSYFVATVGGAPLAVIRQYIENQKRV